ncbi:MAG: twin-arginine translocase TatA/TatE family subunit [Cyclobacteriaceae bacterium]|nr:twin-arginine translocase TatA/TatE family subunit [Cyclobacteriaceae bacterium SS2]
MNTVLLFGMPSGGELLVIGIFIIIFFGAKKIPEIARGLGKGIREFKDAAREVKKEIDEGENASKDNKISS